MQLLLVDPRHGASHVGDGGRQEVHLGHDLLVEQAAKDAPKRVPVRGRVIEAGDAEPAGVVPAQHLYALAHVGNHRRLEARERDEDASALHSPAAPHGHAADVVLHVVGAEARALVPRREALRVPTRARSFQRLRGPPHRSQARSRSEAEGAPRTHVDVGDGHPVPRVHPVCERRLRVRRVQRPPAPSLAAPKVVTDPQRRQVGWPAAVRRRRLRRRQLVIGQVTGALVTHEDDPAALRARRRHVARPQGARPDTLAPLNILRQHRRSLWQRPAVNLQEALVGVGIQRFAADRVRQRRADLRTQLCNQLLPLRAADCAAAGALAPGREVHGQFGGEEQRE
mmetsp:Transcript_51630/g.172311  ORF Transcript_51630/g.172311 Transcript_51630/m.172311 type:complete len:340 (-) Transcript_51630:101-1120(-)